VKLLGDASPSEVAVRLFGARVGREPDVVGYETRKALFDRRTWTASFARDRATAEGGVLAALDPRLAMDSIALEALGRAIPRVLAVRHPSLAIARKAVTEAPSPFVFWSAPPGAPLPELMSSSNDEPVPRLLPISGALGVMVQIAGALRALHEAKVVHGAVEPWAVWVCLDGSVLLMHQGFGVFAEGERRRSKGRRYQLGAPDDGVPPEQLVDDQNKTPAADIYGAGLVLYELLCGARPLRRRTANETLQAILREPPAPPDALRPDVPAALSALTLSMLAKSPAERPQSGAALEEALVAMMPKAEGWRRLLGSAAKPSALVASMMREKAGDRKATDDQ
jgi:protein kinase-like protein